jgi:hypothetical protein
VEPDFDREVSTQVEQLVAKSEALKTLGCCGAVVWHGEGTPESQETLELMLDFANMDGGQVFRVVDGELRKISEVAGGYPVGPLLYLPKIDNQVS